MRIPEILVQILIWLPVVIALTRRCAYRWLILLLCGTIAVIDLYDVAAFLSRHNARHSALLFTGEVLVWLPMFILSIYARTPDERRDSEEGVPPV